MVANEAAGAGLSNRLADLAERAGDAFRHGRARSIEAAQACLEAGRLSVEAKAECPHGQWHLERVDIPYRSAVRTMQIARSDMDAERLAELGIREAVLIRTLFDDGFPGLFHAVGTRISNIIRSLPERRAGAHSV